MIFNMVGGGGIAGLNFEVVGGTTQPTNPKENTIWINTDAKIEGWSISFDEPASPAEGMVWIQNGTADLGAFNALKKNEIRVYPIKASQYIGGAWAEKSAEMYRNGAWGKWIEDLWLIKDGELKTTIARQHADSDKGFLYIGRNADQAAWKFKVDEAGYHYVALKQVDLTNYSTLHVRGWGENGYISVNTTMQHQNSGKVAQVYLGASEVTKTLDVSSLKGLHYIIINTTYIMEVAVKNLYLSA